MTSRSNTRQWKVVVVGAGIIGLSSAVVIAEAFGDVVVHVVADQFTQDTTSSGAGGLWAPEFAHGLQKGPLGAKLREYATLTWHHGRALARQPDACEAGVTFLPYYKLYHYQQDQSSHWWKDLVPDYRRVSNEELKFISPDARVGYMFTSLVMDCTRYLTYLQERLLKAGGKISKQKILSLHEFADKCDVVVNCSGIGARDLNGDMNVGPVRAQTVQVEAPWIHYALEVEPKEATSNYRFYIIPRYNEVILGGTQNHSPDMTVSTQDRDTILAETASIDPSLKKAKFKRDWVGVRPNRSNGLRMGKETIGSGPKQLHVVHNYGHSGQGITLHWGCALEAAKLTREIINNKINTTSKL